MGKRFDQVARRGDGAFEAFGEFFQRGVRLLVALDLGERGKEEERFAVGDLVIAACEVGERRVEPAGCRALN